MKMKPSCEHLVAEVRQEAERLLGGISYEVSFENEDILNRLKRRTRIDLLMIRSICMCGEYTRNWMFVMHLLLLLQLSVPDY